MYHMEWDAPITYTEGGIATHCMGIDVVWWMVFTPGILQNFLTTGKLQLQSGQHRMSTLVSTYKCII